MREYLLDSNIIGAYLLGRSGADELVRSWVQNDETATSILVYGEVCEYLKGFSDASVRLSALRTLMKKVHPYPLTYSSLERYAEIRRALRPPHGSGLIGDIDILIAANALDNGLTLVTTDGDFLRVSDLSVMHIPRAKLKG